jgi:hypothetical protein
MQVHLEIENQLAHCDRIGLITYSILAFCHGRALHLGDVFYTGDIRTLVGVVRWKSEGAKDLAEDYFPEYLQEDLVAGAGVVQYTGRRRS